MSTALSVGLIIAQSMVMTATISHSRSRKTPAISGRFARFIITRLPKREGYWLCKESGRWVNGGGAGLLVELFQRLSRFIPKSALSPRLWKNNPHYCADWSESGRMRYENIIMTKMKNPNKPSKPRSNSPRPMPSLRLKIKLRYCADTFKNWPHAF